MHSCVVKWLSEFLKCSTFVDAVKATSTKGRPLKMPCMQCQQLLRQRRRSTTRKWSIPDAKKDVGIKNIGNEGFSDAINTKSEEASGKHSFPTHHEGVAKYSSEKCPAIFRRCSAAVLRRCPSPPSATLEFWADGHRHFKKYSNPELACANPPNALVGRDEDWHFLYDHYISRAFQEQSRTNKAARQKQPYNHSSGSKSFLQRQYELAERKGKSIDHVELFRETHVRAGTFVSQAADDTHGSQPLSDDEIFDQVLGRRPGYSKGLGWDPS
ncbi:CACTA en-spm transposon protein [Cucumis melo var. makuwa]|uniref:CACTA en-spm transposon protein n=1 Tax=Cucumis melo var. makuwa TaxID=1194695 RepID=A0A5D3DWK6_CUCMM|nr:CACTA en-spm transposon protein [Cucumis melo var. makuwa]